jgi:hypothetical protein
MNDKRRPAMRDVRRRGVFSMELYRFKVEINAERIDLFQENKMIVVGVV